MSKHSPAPWERMIFDDKTYVVDSNDVLVMLYRNPDPQMNDNAQLIAAAPELLEALKTSKLFFEAMIEEQRCGDMSTAAALTLDKITHVINKATGEQP